MPDAPLPPLEIPTERWRSRWLQFNGRSVRLHRVAEITWWDDGTRDDGTPEMIRGDGVTVCGKRGFLHMPGIFSRMGAPRCPACCKALGIPKGDGAPKNTEEAWQDA